MICPRCRSGQTRRSQRHGTKDFLFTLLGMRPWRCRTCDYRFYGRQSPLAFALYVHCPRCGRFDLQKVHRERMSGGFKRLLSTITRVPAYRCDNCRIKFYSARRYRHIVPAEMAQAREEEAPSADEPAVVEAKPES